MRFVDKTNSVHFFVGNSVLIFICKSNFNPMNPDVQIFYGYIYIILLVNGFHHLANEEKKSKKQ